MVTVASGRLQGSKKIAKKAGIVKVPAKKASVAKKPATKKMSLTKKPVHKKMGAKPKSWQGQSHQEVADSRHVIRIHICVL